MKLIPLFIVTSYNHIRINNAVYRWISRTTPVSFAITFDNHAIYNKLNIDKSVVKHP